MTRERDAAPATAARPGAAPASHAPVESAPVAQTRALLETGVDEVAPYAAVLRAHPAATNDIVALLHQTRGNAFASRVIAEVT